jgi:cell shape-determining protein MreC
MSYERNTERTLYNGLIAKVINEYRLIINRGAEEGVEENMTYLVFEVGEEIIDPETGESLGSMEITKGVGKIINVQEKMATIETITTQKIAVSPLESISTGQNHQIKKVPFSNPLVGDRIKLITY